jgi:hypothetical protein
MQIILFTLGFCFGGAFVVAYFAHQLLIRNHAEWLRATEVDDGTLWYNTSRIHYAELEKHPEYKTEHVGYSETKGGTYIVYDQHGKLVYPPA